MTHDTHKQINIIIYKGENQHFMIVNAFGNVSIKRKKYIKHKCCYGCCVSHEDRPSPTPTKTK